MRFGTYISGAAALAVDSLGDAYVTGNAWSGFPMTAGASQRCFDDNAVAVEFSPDGVLLGATYFGPEYKGNNFVSNLYVQAGQINAQVPWEIAGRASTEVRVTYNGAGLNSFPLSVSQAVPGLSILNYPSIQAAVLNANGSINSSANPAKPGDIIALFGTGAGLTNPPGVTGSFWGLGAANTLLTVPVTVRIDGQNAQVIYAGAAPGLLSGYFQINVQVPTDLAADPAVGVDLYLGTLSMPIGQEVDQATIAVK